jgi:hypothetical protein
MKRIHRVKVIKALDLLAGIEGDDLLTIQDAEFKLIDILCHEAKRDFNNAEECLEYFSKKDPEPKCEHKPDATIDECDSCIVEDCILRKEKS